MQDQMHRSKEASHAFRQNGSQTGCRAFRKVAAPLQDNERDGLPTGISSPDVPSPRMRLVLREVLRLLLVAQRWPAAGSEGPIHKHEAENGEGNASRNDP